MTPKAQEIHRIIAGFSDLERELFLSMGGTLPAVKPKPEPFVWRQPNTLEDGARESKRRHKTDAVRKKKDRERAKRKKVIVMAAGEIKPRRRRKEAA